MGIASSQSKKYQVFSALISQSGTGNDTATITSGSLNIGTTYRIKTYRDNDDFTNVGAPNNNEGTYFIATGISPRQWGSATILEYDNSSPVVTILENTFGNTVYLGYRDTGKYSFIDQNNTINTPTLICSPFGMYNSDSLHTLEIIGNTNGIINLESRSSADGGAADSVLANTFIEIRNYNI